MYAYSNPTVYIDLHGYAAQAIITGRVNPDSDAFEPYSNQTHDTGNGLKDLALAVRDDILNIPAGAANIATDITSRVLSVLEIPEKIQNYVTNTTPEERQFVSGNMSPGSFPLATAVVNSPKLLSTVAKVRHVFPKLKTAVKTIEDIAGGALPKVGALIKEEQAVKKEATAVEGAVSKSAKVTSSNYPNPDLPMDAPPVRYQPKTREELIKMRQGKRPTSQSTHGDQNIEYHHREQRSVENDAGIIDEVTEKSHRRNGNHARHGRDSTISDRQREKEIRKHVKEVGPTEGAKYFIDGEGI